MLQSARNQCNEDAGSGPLTPAVCTTAQKSGHCTSHLCCNLSDACMVPEPESEAPVWAPVWAAVLAPELAAAPVLVESAAPALAVG